MYANELFIGSRIKLSEDIGIYYDIEGIHAPAFTAQAGFDKKPALGATIRKLLSAKSAA